MFGHLKVSGLAFASSSCRLNAANAIAVLSDQPNLIQRFLYGVATGQTVLMWLVEKIMTPLD